MESERLTIRPFQENDLEEIYRLVYADEEVHASWSNFSGSFDEFRQRFKSDKNWTITGHGFGYWRYPQIGHSVARLDGISKPRRRVDGLVDHARRHAHVGQVRGRIDAELTYALGKPYWRHGYAVESGRALLQYGFRELRITRVINAIDAANYRSRNLLSRSDPIFCEAKIRLR